MSLDAIDRDSELKRQDGFWGWTIALLIFGLWISSTIFLLVFDLNYLNWLAVFIWIWGRTFIQTGLFILAHDAMHGSLIPLSPRWNRRLGAIALGLYAGLSFDICCRNHAKHHRYPGQGQDPDFHDGINSRPWQWYLKFMREYLSVVQGLKFLTIVLIVGTIAFCLHISLLKLWLWWIFPLVLSSIQLFIFGTYLPHDRMEDSNRHCARTIDYPVWWSFLSCYHFGYHWEHHEYPHTPWYRLPDLFNEGRR
jgi:beta-carotene/zeaxanthin 4-ketolase